MMPRLANNKTSRRVKTTSRKIVSAARTQLVRGAAASPKALLSDVRELILTAREGVARAVNAGLATLYWQIGRRIHQDVLKEKRAEYGRKIVAALGRQLETEFGQGFTEKNIWRMVQFAEAFPDEQIVAALRRQLGWTHFRQLIPIEDPLKRDFYAEMCRIERWNTRTLAKKIGGMLFERTAISKKPDQLIRRELKALRDEDQLTPDLVFRDPYVLDFLKLKDTYSEGDVEAALLREIESFILELGDGFCFIARQKRMQIDDRDYHLDLLFYHRKLRRLVAIDLKLEEFDAADKGQMELYLNWLKKNEQGADEAPPLGIILCAGKRQEHVELLGMERDGIHVASYVTKLLPKKQLERKLHQAVRLARARLANQKLSKA
jgi:predicted nuclease of restriction endonuclease-like (RecB) superfamily